jgi:hypothetical protein
MVFLCFCCVFVYLTYPTTIVTDHIRIATDVGDYISALIHYTDVGDNIGARRYDGTEMFVLSAYLRSLTAYSPPFITLH